MCHMVDVCARGFLQLCPRKGQLGPRRSPQTCTSVFRRVARGGSPSNIKGLACYVTGRVGILKLHLTNKDKRIRIKSLGLLGQIGVRVLVHAMCTTTERARARSSVHVRGHVRAPPPSHLTVKDKKRNLHIRAPECACMVGGQI